MFEEYGPILFQLGVVLTVASWLWLTVRAFAATIGWGLAVLFVPVLGAFAFFFYSPRRAASPLLLFLLGLVLVGGTLGANDFDYSKLMHAPPAEAIDVD